MAKRKRKPKQHRNAFGQFTPSYEQLYHREVAEHRETRAKLTALDAAVAVGTFFAKPKPTLWQRIKATIKHRLRGE